MKFTKCATLLGLGIIFSFLSLCAQDKLAIPPLDSLKKWQEELKVPIVAVGIIENGKIKETKIFGELKSGVPAPANTFFNIASMTKPVVGMLTLHLVSKGMWNLDEPLSDYFVDPDVASDSRLNKLTTRIVLAHQTGLPNWRGNDTSKKMTFAFEPGTDIQYSGEGYMYLGHALESKFKMSLQQLADSFLFKPLGMKHTRFYWDSTMNESLYADRYDKNGKALEMEKWYEANAANLLMTTIEDYCKFGVSVVQRKGISKKVYKEMITPQAPKGKSIYWANSKNVSYGLSWGLIKNLRNDEYALFHKGRNPGLNTIIVLLPKSKRGIVILTNGENGLELYSKIISQSLYTETEFLERLKSILF